MGLLNSIRALLGGTPPPPAQRSAPMSPAPSTPKAQFTFSAEVVTEPHERSYLGQDDLTRLLKPNADGLAPVHFIRRGDALWLAEDTTGKLINLDARGLRRLGIWGVKVRGRSLYDGAQRLGPADLIREPDNPHDPNAVAIHVDGHMIGYYNKGMAPGLAKLLDAGEPIEATVISTNPAKVLAARSEVLAHLRRHL
ncbi:HIRAN domain-containing protein [Microbacterium sp. NPDC055988]|uniref:HIRAN domain-containing protein n=1 Tax=Microbacterium sp. NPDC055988 TaxID=3345671 RepID=UPI0035D5A39D